MFARVLQGTGAQEISGRALTADIMTTHKTFDRPEVVKPAAFDNYKLRDNTLTVTLPAKSVVLLEIK